MGPGSHFPKSEPGPFTSSEAAVRWPRGVARAACTPTHAHRCSTARNGVGVIFTIRVSLIESDSDPQEEMGPESPFRLSPSAWNDVDDSWWIVDGLAHCGNSSFHFSLSPFPFPLFPFPFPLFPFPFPLFPFPLAAPPPVAPAGVWRDPSQEKPWSVPEVSRGFSLVHDVCAERRQ